MPTVTNAGRAYITSLIKLASRPATEPNYVAMGTGTTAENATDTALVTEVETRANGTSSQTTTSQTNDTYTTIGTVTATATRVVTESGIFSASAAGTMAARSMFNSVPGSISLASGDSIQFTWGVKLG